ncbi:peptide ABC transporter substrate-binding protein [Pseudoroseicyclus aestuarii]|nr:peptide ABC transporter substrate-binding protein [Pseudoroseicyclus aestuarii]
MRLKTALLGAAALTALAPAAMAQPTERGASGHLGLFYWQAPSVLNPYLSAGTKDLEASSLMLEPLARYDENGTMVPYLAAEIPTVENGGVSEDLTSITWTLAEGVLWSDGSPLTAEDVRFTWEYCTAEGGGCAQLAKFEGVTDVEVVDDQTVTVRFDGPQPNPYTAFVGYQGPILNHEQFADCLGPAAPQCTEANFGPIGTGPYVVTDFRPNDVVQLEANENYRDASKPYFATVTMKGGGDATAAARAVLETGEYDYAWNLQLAPDVLEGMVEGGTGQLNTAFGASVERIEANLTDASPDLPEGERSTVAHPHPFLTDPAVREALSMAIDRTLLTEIGYGEAGRPTCDLVPAPELYASGNTDCIEQDLEGAMQMLEEAGYTDTNGDGVRETPDGEPLEMLYQTSTNAVRQDYQALIKEWWEQIGFSVELRNIDSSVFFGGDPGSPDTFQRFYADVEMYTNTFDGTDPQAYLSAYTCNKIPSPDSAWVGENINRYCSEDYDALIAELGETADLDERGRIAKQMNDMLTNQSHIIIPLTARGELSGVANSLGGVKLNAWDSELWNIADWYRIEG